MHYRLRMLLIALLAALPLLPLCTFVLKGSPQAVFLTGAASFFAGVMLFILLIARSFPSAGFAPANSRLHFSIRDLLCLTTVVLGTTLFIGSLFKCEAAERATRPRPLPVDVFRQHVWEMESGLACITVAGLIWIRSAHKTGEQ